MRDECLEIIVNVIITMRFCASDQETALSKGIISFNSLVRQFFAVTIEQHISVSYSLREGPWCIVLIIVIDILPSGTLKLKNQFQEFKKQFLRYGG